MSKSNNLIVSAVLAIVLVAAHVPTKVKAQDDSLAGSFLSGLLDTITSTADSKDCPGVCVHTLATLICYEVLEDIACPSANMKCCIESAPTSKVPAVTEEQSDVPSPSPTTTTTTITTTLKTKPTTKRTTITTKKVTTKSPPSKAVASDKSDTVDPENTCVGVCVADRIADYCEAYLRTPGLCKIGTKCCVSIDEYEGKSAEDLYIPASEYIFVFIYTLSVCLFGKPILKGSKSTN